MPKPKNPATLRGNTWTGSRTTARAEDKTGNTDRQRRQVGHKNDLEAATVKAYDRDLAEIQNYQGVKYSLRDVAADPQRYKAQWAIEDMDLGGLEQRANNAMVSARNYLTGDYKTGMAQISSLLDEVRTAAGAVRQYEEYLPGGTRDILTGLSGLQDSLGKTLKQYQAREYQDLLERAQQTRQDLAQPWTAGERARERRLSQNVEGLDAGQIQNMITGLADQIDRGDGGRTGQADLDWYRDYLEQLQVQQGDWTGAARTAAAQYGDLDRERQEDPLAHVPTQYRQGEAFADSNARITRLEDLEARQNRYESNAWYEKAQAAIDELPEDLLAALDQYNGRTGQSAYDTRTLGSGNQVSIYNGTAGASRQRGLETLQAAGLTDQEIAVLAEQRAALQDREQTLAEQERIARQATQNPYYEAVYSAASALASPVKGLGLVESARAALGGYADPDRPTNVYAGAFAGSQYQQAVREPVAEKWGERLDAELPRWLGTTTDENGEVRGQKLGTWLYNTVMSAADSAVNMAAARGITGLSGAAATPEAISGTMNWLMGSEAAADGVIEGIEKGYSNEKALALGIIQGAIEGITEKYSVEAFLSEATMARRLGKSFLAEGSEEVASNWLNRLVDLTANNSQAEAVQIYHAHKAEGGSDAAALAKTLLDLLGEDVNSFLAGGLSGLAMSGTSEAAGAVERRGEYSWYGMNLRGELDDLIRRGLESESGTQANELAQKLEGMDRSSISDYQIGRLAQAVQEIQPTPGAEQEDGTEAPQTGETAQKARTQDPGAETRDEAAQGSTEARERTDAAEEEEETKDPKAAETFRNVGEAVRGESWRAREIFETDFDAETQDQGQYAEAWQAAYEMGKGGLSLERTAASNLTAALTDYQRQRAWTVGRGVTDQKAAKQQEKTSFLPNDTGWQQGRVRAIQGTSLEDFRNSFNDTQRQIYPMLERFSQLTGWDIVLYKSGLDTSLSPEQGGEYVGPEGYVEKADEYGWTGAIYLDLNAGLKYGNSAESLQKYAMLRTLSHETTHMARSWNSVEWADFQRTVFEIMERQGVDTDELIRKKADDLGLSYEAAAEEAVADAMLDMWGQSNVMQELAEKHQTMLQKMLEVIREFVQKVRDYWNRGEGSAYTNQEVLALQKQGEFAYLDEVIAAYDSVVLGAVERYQSVGGNAETGRLLDDLDREETVSTYSQEDQKYIAKVEQEAWNGLSGVVGVKKSARKSGIQEIVRPLTEELLQNGTVSEQAMTHAVDWLWNNAETMGTIGEGELNKQIRDYIRDTPIYVPEFVKTEFKQANGYESYNEFRKSAMGRLNLVNDKRAMAPDSFYKELQEVYPGWFNEDLSTEAEMLVKMYEVSRDAYDQELTLDDVYSGESAEELENEMYDRLAMVLVDMFEKYQRAGLIRSAAERQKAVGQKTTETQRRNKARANTNKIRPDMDDESRAEVLRNKSVTILTYDENTSKGAAEVQALQGKYRKEAKELLDELANNCAAFRSDLHNAEVDLIFEFSRSSLRESRNKQEERGENEADLGKALTLLPELCETAVEVEAHTDIYRETIREDRTLKEQHILVSAFFDGNRLVPVEFEIKEFYENARKNNKLHLTVTVTDGIKNEAAIIAPTTTNKLLLSSTYAASAISISDLVAGVNEKNGDFLKYFPDSMLSEAQIEAKNRALERDEEKKAALAQGIRPDTSRTRYKARQNSTDSTGRELSQGQREYFEGSQVRDEQGRLIPMYHGTDADFWTFDTSISGGKNGTAEGYGIYFADSPDITKSYGNRQLAGYINSQRPATAWEKTIKRSELQTLIRKTCEQEAERMVEDDDYSTTEKALRDTWVSNYVYTYDYSSMAQCYKAVADSILSMNDNDADIVQEVMNGLAIHDYASAMDFYHNILTPTTGIDSLWSKWTNRETGQQSNVVVVFDSNQFKIAGNEKPTASQDIRYKARQATLDTEALLEQAAADLIQQSQTQQGLMDYTSAEADALQIFSQRVAELRKLRESRTEMGKRYRAFQFGSEETQVDRERAARILEQMHGLDDTIRDRESRMYDIQNARIMREIIEKVQQNARRQQEQATKEWARQYYAEREEHTQEGKLRKAIMKDVGTLRKHLENPSNKDTLRHIPAGIQGSVAEFLQAIDPTSARALNGGSMTQADRDFKASVDRLKNALYANEAADELYSGYRDLPPDFQARMQKLSDTVSQMLDTGGQSFVLNRMTREQLEELQGTVRTLKRYVTMMNELHNNAMFQHAYEAGDSTLEHLESFSREKKTNFLRDAEERILEWRYGRPFELFQRFGDGGRSIFKEFMDGQDTMAFREKEIEDFTRKTFTKEEVKAWEKDTFTTRLESGETVETTIAEAMSLYELAKRPQAQGHIFAEQGGQGIRVRTRSQTRLGVKTGTVADQGHLVTKADVEAITGQLTDRQKEVADALQQHMAKTGGEWGNYVTVARWDQKHFGEETYFPINSDGGYIEKTVDESPEAASLYALLNMSFTKQLQEGANNRILLYDIFDVYANHMASMAQYNAYALPILDALKWFNYTVKAENGEQAGEKRSVRDAMRNAFGSSAGTGTRAGSSYAEQFVVSCLKTLNGTAAQGSRYEGWWNTLVRNANVAKVAGNLSVAVKQPLAIIRAAYVIDPKNLAKGAAAWTHMRKSIQEMEENCGIALWKSLGFYDNNISSPMTDRIKHRQTLGEQFREKSMILAELGDRTTWAVMWEAAKAQTGGDRKAAADLFQEMVYKTQVVDAPMAKNEFLRNATGVTRALGSFMNESMTAASNVVNTYAQYKDDAARLGKGEALRQNKSRIGKAAAIYAVNAVMTGLVTAMVGAWRGDPDDSFSEKFRDKLAGDILSEANPLNMLPIASKLWDVAKQMLDQLPDSWKKKLRLEDWDPDYFGLTDYGFEIVDDTMSLLEVLQQLDEGKAGYTQYKAIYTALKAVSDVSGLPFASLTREGVTAFNHVREAWNATIGDMAPSLFLDYPIETYRRGTEYYDHILNDAMENNGRYEATYGRQRDKLIAKYLTAGQSREEAEAQAEKTLTGGLTAALKGRYQAGELTREEAEQWYQQITGNGADAAYWKLEEWDSGEETYSKYDTLRAAIGALSVADYRAARQALIDHGTSESTITGQTTTGIGDLYKAGEITRYQASQALQVMNGKTQAEADRIIDDWDEKIKES